MYNILYENGRRLVIVGKKRVAESQMFSTGFYNLDGMKSRQVESQNSVELEYGLERRLGNPRVPSLADR